MGSRCLASRDKISRKARHLGPAMHLKLLAVEARGADDRRRALTGSPPALERRLIASLKAQDCAD